jgi:glucose-1-phosphate cytidylyltransferase
MKIVILAGGLGTRLMEETEARPKPMVEIGGMPILWHIMKIYESYGYREFIICLGYKAQYVKQYFLNYYLFNSDVTVDLSGNKVEVHVSKSESFIVTLVDTGLYTNTAGRIKRIEKYISEDVFMLTYGDGVANINLSELLRFHLASGKIATLTTVQLPGRFGNIVMDSCGSIESFIEKPLGEGLWINAGFFVLNRSVFRYLKGEMDFVQWEKGPLLELSRDRELMAYRHTGFWKCMDALRDRIELEELWNTGKAEWKTWE